KSLANGKGLQAVLSIIESKVKDNQNIAVVVSARGNATNELEAILEKAATNQSFKEQLEGFKRYQIEPFKTIDFSEEFSKLEKLFEGVSLLQDYSERIKDEVLAQGELLATKLVTQLLKERNIKAYATDSRVLIKTDENFGNAQPILAPSKSNIKAHFEKYNGDTVHIVSGFIASNLKDQTTTLGRNGSNYTASLLANYLDAEELESYTHVNGIYTANPDLVLDAKKINHLSYDEANELANFGTTILHAKTIIPLLEKRSEERRVGKERRR